MKKNTLEIKKIELWINIIKLFSLIVIVSLLLYLVIVLKSIGFGFGIYSSFK